MNITLKIIITKDYKLLIQIDSKYTKEEINLCICFNSNFIEIGKENENSIHFIQEWLTNPEEYKIYSVQYQRKDYELLPEVFFAIIINEFKQKIEKEYIIENTVIEIPTENKKVLQRIKIALNALGLRGMELDEDIDYNYTEQGDYLHEILEKKETKEKQKRMLERAKQINPLSEDKLNEIDLKQENIVEEEEFGLELIKRFTTKERSEMKLSNLDNYCIFIASRFFKSLQDHQNLTKVSKKYKLNMEKFHYNPISVDGNSVKLFPNIESFHIYKEGLNDMLIGIEKYHITKKKK